MTRVIDTSVVAKWFVAEEGQAAAERLIGEPLVAPDLILAEVANLAWRKWRAREIGREQALLALQMVGSFVEVAATALLAERAMEMALVLDHPAYDCFFLALAEELGTILITADARLAKVCGTTPLATLIEVL